MVRHLIESILLPNFGHSWTDWGFIMEYDHTEVTIRDEAGKSNRNAMREAFAVFEQLNIESFLPQSASFEPRMSQGQKMTDDR